MANKGTTQRRLAGLFFYGTAILVVYLAYLVFEPFLVPLAWAGVLAVVTYPVYRWLRRRRGANFSAAVSTAGVTLVIIVPAILVLIAFIQQAFDAARSVHIGVVAGHYAWVNRLYADIQSHLPQLPANLGDLVRSYAETAAAYIGARLGAILRNTAEFVVNVSLTILALFYFFRDGDAIVEHLRRALPFEEAEQNRVVDNTHELMFATVTSSLVAAAMHGVIGGVAFAATGIKAPIFWGVLMGFFSLIPLIGTALIWVPLSVGLILGGHLASGIILAAVCSVIVGMVDNILRPLLISGRAQMSTLAIFIGVLGGVSVFGMLGVVLGPIVIATAGTLLDFYAPPGPSGNGGFEADGKTKDAVLE